MGMHALPAHLLLLAQMDSPVSWASLVVSIIVAVFCVIQFFRPAPALHETYARRDDHKGLEAKLEALLRQEGEHYAGILEAGSERASRLHSRIDSLSERVADLAVKVAALESLGKKGSTHGTD